MRVATYHIMYTTKRVRRLPVLRVPVLRVPNLKVGVFCVILDTVKPTTRSRFLSISEPQARETLENGIMTQRLTSLELADRPSTQTTRGSSAATASCFVINSARSPDPSTSKAASSERRHEREAPGDMEGVYKGTVRGQKGRRQRGQ